MGTPVSLILIALGAILVWGVNAHAKGVNVDAVGVILMIVGLLGFLLSLRRLHALRPWTGLIERGFYVAMLAWFALVSLRLVI